MAFQKKVMILCDIKTGVGSGILRFVSDSGRSEASVSLHVPESDDAKILLRVDDKITVYDAKDGDVLALSVPSLPDDIDCLVTRNGKPVLFGTTGNDRYRCFNLLNEYEKTKKEKRAKNKPRTTKNDEIIDNSSDADKKTDADTAVNARVCEESDGAENNVEQDIITDENGGFTVETAENKQNNLETSMNFTKNVEYDGNDFYLAVKPQLDEMFICFPAETELENAVPNSKWVRVENSDGFYVVGIIYDLDVPTYISYGVPYEKRGAPPEEIKDVCDWLPLSLDDVDGKGYYLIYQSAATGKTVVRPEERNDA